MIYLAVGLALGIVIGRYIFPIFDMLLEMLQYKITQICTIIQVNTNLVSLEYEQVANKHNELSPVIGFLADRQRDDEEFIEEDDEENKANCKSKIGFIK